MWHCLDNGDTNNNNHNTTQRVELWSSAGRGLSSDLKEMDRSPMWPQPLCTSRLCPLHLVHNKHLTKVELMTREWGKGVLSKTGVLKLSLNRRWADYGDSTPVGRFPSSTDQCPLSMPGTDKKVDYQESPDCPLLWPHRLKPWLLPSTLWFWSLSSKSPKQPIWPPPPQFCCYPAALATQTGRCTATLIFLKAIPWSKAMLLSLFIEFFSFIWGI